jgi:uncharacterized protein with HEPN domain
MSIRDLQAYLIDIKECCGHIASFIADKTFENYQNDVMLRSAVERQLTILAEAFNQASKHYPEIISHISNIPEIVGFRNRIIHEYAAIDNTFVWSIVTIDLSQTHQEVEGYMQQLDNP